MRAFCHTVESANGVAYRVAESAKTRSCASAKTNDCASATQSASDCAAIYYGCDSTSDYTTDYDYVSHYDRASHCGRDCVTDCWASRERESERGRDGWRATTMTTKQQRWLATSTGISRYRVIAQQRNPITTDTWHQPRRRRSLPSIRSLARAPAMHRYRRPLLSYLALLVVVLLVAVSVLADEEQQQQHKASKKELDCEELGFGATLVCSTCQRLAELLSPSDRTSRRLGGRCCGVVRVVARLS